MEQGAGRSDRQPGSAVAGDGVDPAERTERVESRPDALRAARPIRKGEIVLEERGLYVESWLPERRSRRRPLYLLHGELGGSWLWERYLAYFARRGWEAHALNLRAHFWSETVADMAELDFAWYLEDARAGLQALSRPPVVVGHGLGGLLALKLVESQPVAGLVLISPALPTALREPLGARPVRDVPRVFRRDQLGWGASHESLRRQNPDLSLADVMRVRHMMGAESAKAREAAVEGVAVDRAALGATPTLVIGGGVDRLFPEAESERLAEWLGAEYQPFGAHSHFGLVIGEHSHEQVADAIRGFLDAHKL